MGVSIDYGVRYGGVFFFLVVLFLYYLVYCFVLRNIRVLSNYFTYSLLYVNILDSASMNTKEVATVRIVWMMLMVLLCCTCVVSNSNVNRIIKTDMLINPSGGNIRLVIEKSTESNEGWCESGPVILKNLSNWCP